MNPNPNKETPEQELEHKLHILVCRTLGLDDEDHEDDELAEPLEKAILELFATHYKAREAELLEELNQVCIYKPFDVHTVILNKIKESPS